MVFIKYENINGKNKVTYVHYKPLDEEIGLGKTVEELSKEGILIETLALPKQTKEKDSVMMYDVESKSIYYEYEDIPKQKELKLQERISALEKSNAELTTLITMSMTPQQ